MTRHLLALLPWLCLALLPACTPSAGDDDDSEEPTPEPRPAPDYEGGESCPTLDEGWTDEFPSGGLDRRVKVSLPDDPSGAPVVFVWHWLGGTVDEILSYMEFDELPDDEGVIVVAPQSSGSAFEWAFFSEPEGNIDLALFTDLLACLDQQYDVDLDRVYATGMSAGGLWTSYLTMHAAEWLAATAPFSGGVSEDQFVAPERALPVLVTWGGPTDASAGYDFHEGSMTLSASLQEAGSFVVECEHDDGHLPPNSAKDDAWRFFAAHPYGVDPEPYADGLPNGYPSFCEVPE